MGISATILYNIAKRWPSPVPERANLGKEINSSDYRKNYAFQKQYLTKIKKGFKHDFMNKKVLEIGCGHGGISLFLAVNFAEEVIGIDINTENLAVADEVKKEYMDRYQTGRLPLQYQYMFADKMSFNDNQFDLILAENVFEHFVNLDGVLNECHRVLKPGGKLLVTAMPSIYSKHGLHLKLGLKLPWANLIWSEKTIIEALHMMAEDNPDIYKFYPGLTENPKRIVEIRKYKDLNYITNAKFKRAAINSGFIIEQFSLVSTGFKLGKIFKRIPVLKNTLLTDIFSYNSNFVLRKP